MDIKANTTIAVNHLTAGPFIYFVLSDKRIIFTSVIRWILKNG